MAVEVMGIDHVYVAVRDMERSEEFYDRVMAVLGFRKRRGTIYVDKHVDKRRVGHLKPDTLYAENAIVAKSF